MTLILLILLTSDVGPSGYDGPIGPMGIKGITGAAGEQGDKGAAGPTGARGTKGPRGPRGERGPAGVPGPKGPQGIHAASGWDGAYYLTPPFSLWTYGSCAAVCNLREGVYPQPDDRAVACVAAKWENSYTSCKRVAQRPIPSVRCLCWLATPPDTQQWLGP
jgi:hypothetical protein